MKLIWMQNEDWRITCGSIIIIQSIPAPSNQSAKLIQTNEISINSALISIEFGLIWLDWLMPEWLVYYNSNSILMQQLCLNLFSYIQVLLFVIYFAERKYYLLAVAGCVDFSLFNPAISFKLQSIRIQLRYWIWFLEFDEMRIN